MRDPNRNRAFVFNVTGVGTFEATRLRFGEMVELAAAARDADATEFLRTFAAHVLLDDTEASLSRETINRFDEGAIEQFADLCLAYYDTVTRQKTYDKMPSDEGTRIKATHGDFLLSREQEEGATEYFFRLFKQYVESSDTLSGRMSERIKAGAEDWMRQFRAPLTAIGAAQVGMSKPASRGASAMSLPPALPVMPDIPTAARSVLNRFEERLRAFREGLHEDEEALITMTSGLYGESLLVDQWATLGAETISISGQLVGGAMSEVVQHYSQFSLTLTASPKPLGDRSVGFVRHATGEGAD